MKTEGSVINQNGPSRKLFLSEASELGGSRAGRVSTGHMDPQVDGVAVTTVDYSGWL